MQDKPTNESSNSLIPAAGIGRRRVLKSGVALGAAAAMGGFLSACSSESGSTPGSSGSDTTTGASSASNQSTGEPITVGFLTDLSGTTAALGDIQFNCFELAVNEINEAGGIDGRELRFIREDDGNDTNQVIEKATKLAVEDGVTAVIGQITSLTRQASLTVLPNEKVPLMYSTYYEGAASGDGSSCNPFLTAHGQVPNQQVDPLVPWLTENVGQKYMVVGNDYVWATGTTQVLEDLVAKDGGTITSTEFFPFGTTDFGPTFQKLEKEAPEICFTLLAGGDFTTFRQQWDQFGPDAKLVSLAMDNVRAGANPGVTPGAIASQAYFMEVDNEANKKFIESYQAAYAESPFINSIGEACYTSVHMMKLAIEAADGSTDPSIWVPKLGEVTFDAPSGTVTMDPNTQHTVTNNYIAEVNEDGSMTILDTQESIDPIVEGCKIN